MAFIAYFRQIYHYSYIISINIKVIESIFALGNIPLLS